FMKEAVTPPRGPSTSAPRASRSAWYFHVSGAGNQAQRGLLLKARSPPPCSAEKIAQARRDAGCLPPRAARAVPGGESATCRLDRGQVAGRGSVWRKAQGIACAARRPRSATATQSIQSILGD